MKCKRKSCNWHIKDKAYQNKYCSEECSTIDTLLKDLRYAQHAVKILINHIGDYFKINEELVMTAYNNETLDIQQVIGIICSQGWKMRDED